MVNNEESENTLQEHNDPHRFTCYCGKKCKGLHGLKAHQHSCHVVDILNIKELFEMQDEYVSEKVTRNAMKKNKLTVLKNEF